MIVRRIARPLLSSLFVAGGFEGLKAMPPKPGQKVPQQVQMLQANSAVMLLGGLGLATNRLPRISSLLLATSLVPTTYMAHPFWKAKDAGGRNAQRVQFLKNTSLLGGLLIAAVDTAGKESAPRKAKRAAKQATTLAKGKAAKAVVTR